MAVLESRTLDMAQLLMQAYELGDLINASSNVSEYLHWKAQVEANDEVKRLVRLFEQKKAQFEDCERFGHYHPDYHAALKQVKDAEEQLNQIEAVRCYKDAEADLDDLLYQVSEIIAHAVSDTIKVPGNNPLPNEGGCASGGSCSGGCG